MGNLCGATDGEKSIAVKSRRINEQIAEEAISIKSHIKLLLLGTGGCGKSTILKQMKILHNNGFSDTEIQQQRAAIFSNTVGAMNTLLLAMGELMIGLDSTDRDLAAQTIMNAVLNNEQSEPLTKEIADALKELWTDYGVKEAYERRAEFQLFDAADYFFDSVDRIADPNYRPSEQDILFVRVKTVGIYEVHFTIKEMFFRVFDVGGQRSERRKWIHCFDDVNSIIFITAISEYDQVLEEDSKTNRLKESLTLYETIRNSKWFSRTSMIIFLNKMDLFEEKIQKISLTVCFPEFDGGKNYDLSVEFLEEQFDKLNQNENKTYLHRTCATDTNQVQIVLDNVLDMIISQNVQGCALA